MPFTNTLSLQEFYFRKQSRDPSIRLHGEPTDGLIQQTRHFSRKLPGVAEDQTEVNAV